MARRDGLDDITEVGPSIRSAEHVGRRSERRPQRRPQVGWASSAHISVGILVETRVAVPSCHHIRPEVVTVTRNDAMRSEVPRRRNERSVRCLPHVSLSVVFGVQGGHFEVRESATD